MKVREGEEEVRARVCTEAMDFMEGMRDGWNGLLTPVAPNVVSFNIIVKVSIGVLGGRSGIISLLLFLKDVQSLVRPATRTLRFSSRMVLTFAVFGIVYLF